jgi:hypothetical protein
MQNGLRQKNCADVVATDGRPIVVACLKYDAKTCEEQRRGRKARRPRMQTDVSELELTNC